jgi:beta-phosphoglucomutase-like phosphatase (HAD superfamily)
LVETDHLHYKVWIGILEKLDFKRRTGIEFDQTFYDKHMCGVANNDIVATVLKDFKEFSGPDAKQKFDREKEAQFRELFRQNKQWSALPGVVNLVESFDRDSIPAMICTNAPRENAKAMLQGINLLSRFEKNFLTCAEECKVRWMLCEE